MYVCFHILYFTDPTNTLILRELDNVHKNLFNDVVHACTFSECNGFAQCHLQQAEHPVHRPMAFHPFTFPHTPYFGDPGVHQFVPYFQHPVQQHIQQPVQQHIQQPVQQHIDEGTITSPGPTVNPDIPAQGSPIIARSRSRRRLNELSPIESKVNQVVNLLVEESPDTVKEILKAAKYKYSVRKLGMDTDESVGMTE